MNINPKQSQVDTAYVDRLFGKTKAINDFLFNHFSDGYWYISFEEVPRMWLSQKIWSKLGRQVEEPLCLITEPYDVIDCTELEDILEWSRNVLDYRKDIVMHTFNFFDLEGSRVWMKGKGFLDVDEETGKFNGVGGFCEDISEEYEQDTLTLENNLAAKIGSWSMNLITHKVYWDEVTCAIHEVPGDHMPEFEEAVDYYKEGENRDRLIACVERLKSTGYPYDEKFEFVTHQNNKKWVRVIGNVKFIKGVPVKIYGIIQDITSIELAEENNKKLANLRSKSEELEQFAYITSHDLREPLITVQGYLDLLKADISDHLSEETGFLLDRSISTLNRLDHLIKDLLHYSRTSRIEELVEVSLDECLDLALKNLDAKILTTQSKILRTPLIPIKGSNNKLVLLFQNIISNAIKFSKEDTFPEISISSSECSENYHVHISDKGIGIKEEEINTVFQIFGRAHKDLEIPGSGIGLSICKKIMELHDGDIQVSSVLGEGSTFTLLFSKKNDYDRKVAVGG